MKTLKTQIEILLTIACLVMIFVLAQRHHNAPPPPSVDVAAMEQILMASPAGQTRNSTAGQVMGFVSDYDVMKTMGNEEAIKALAEQKAQEMLQTGDMEWYHGTLEDHGLIPVSTEK